MEFRVYYTDRTVDDSLDLTDGIQAVLSKRDGKWCVQTGSGFPAWERVVYAYKDGWYVTTERDEFCKDARCFFGSTVTDEEFHAVATKAMSDLREVSP